MYITVNTMKGTPSREWVDELRRRSDIVQIVSETVKLKRSGNRYTGLCPFHHEKTASFFVNADQQVYYCFGCKAGGDVIKFVMDSDRLPFMDAVRYLADRANILMPESAVDPETYRAERSERERILELNKKAARYYHDLIWKPEGAEVLDYFHRRGLTDSDIRKYGLGASVRAGTALTKLLGETDEDVSLMVKAGLSVSKDGRVFDFFRGRAMFPILGVRGEVLAFGGRALGDAQPKYLNTSDTPVFNKRHNVYGAYLLKGVKALTRVVLVEGYMDALSLLTHDTQGVVATLGTSLTSEQVRLLKRYAHEIWIAYDGDEPGQKAAMRALEICEESDVNARVVLFPDQMDPDEYVRSDGAGPFDKLERLTPPQFRLRRLIRNFDMANQEGRTDYAKEAAKVLCKVSEPVELENLLGRLVIETDFSRDVLLLQIDRAASTMGIAANILGHRMPRSSAAYPSGQIDPPPSEPPPAFAPDSLKAARLLLLLLSRGEVGGGVAPEDFVQEIHIDMASLLLAGRRLADIVSDYERDGRDEWRREALEISAVSIIVPEERKPQIVNDLIERMNKGRIALDIKNNLASLNAEQGAARAEGLLRMQKLLEEKNGPRSGRKE